MAILFGKKRNQLELPISKSKQKLSPKRRDNGSQYWLKLTQFWKNNNRLLVVLLVIIGLLSLSRKLVSNWGESGTRELQDLEYYDFDFLEADMEALQKYDNGADHFLITKGGKDVLQPGDKELYDQEIEMLYGSTVQTYNLDAFRGTTEGAKNREHVLLLVPLRNAERVLPLMFKNLMNLTYPHELIDIAFLVSDCTEDDNTLGALIEYSKALQSGTLSDLFAENVSNEQLLNEEGTRHLFLKYMRPSYLQMVEKAYSAPFHSGYDKPFRSVQIFQKDFGQAIGQGFSDRHAVKVQGIRRKLMGRARNWLTANALKPYHSWVYWRDADVELCPGSVIQDLMSIGYDVAVPNVWRPLPEFLDGEQPYDLNSWPESPDALRLAQGLDEDDVIVEGYAEYPTYRVHLAYIRDPNGNPKDVLELDGVGGVSILAKAQLFRNGVHFPAFTFENHAETEAFGKMAKKMGYRVAGLPNYTLWHIYEPSDDDLKAIAERERGSKRTAEGSP
ncbi:LADA_0H05226g1_1 [Lachancea dasiensis]|uniref:LADA_0H05226g1_1 n=1 Tax=Lachancea dasiensis TaxID=1072105 RepID=A0A1G4K129_9SACH|nr:LADA_0H05226g1_1 [Lachancea dasiensis]